MTDLRSRARGARPTPEGNGRRGQAEPVIGYEVGDDPEAVHVNLAWNRVMRFCKALTKGSIAEVKEKGTGRVLYTYKYRGVDDVVTLAGTAFRLFGIRTTPVEIQVDYRPSGQMMLCFATVTYEVTSLDGSSFRGVAKSEGIDNADKSTVKAEQQAYRVFLTTALSLPTYDPTLDSDATPMLRPEPPGPFGLRDEILEPKTSVQRLLAIQGELRRDPGLAATRVPVPPDDAELTLWDLVVRERKQRETARDTARDVPPERPVSPAPEPPTDGEPPE